MRDKIVWDSTLELLAFSDMVRLNIMQYNSLDSEECYSSILIKVIRPQSAC